MVSNSVYSSSLILFFSCNTFLILIPPVFFFPSDVFYLSVLEVAFGSIFNVLHLSPHVFYGLFFLNILSIFIVVVLKFLSANSIIFHL